MTVPARLRGWIVHCFTRVADGALAHRWNFVHLFIGAMTLITFNDIDSVARVVPLGINFRGDLLMALYTWAQFFLRRHRWMLRQNRPGTF